MSARPSVAAGAPPWLGPAVVATAALALAPLVFRAAFHCDELTVLRHLTYFASGDFSRPGRPGLLWLVLAPLVWLGEPARIALAGRAVAWLAATGTLAMVWKVASRPGPDEDERPWVGGVAVGLLVGAMAWHAHAWEIRTDSFTTPLTLLFAWLLWRDEHDRRRIVGLGLLVAALGLISQKSIYNVGAISAGYAAWAVASPGPTRPWARLRTLGAIAGIGVVCVVAWYGLMAALSGTGSEFVEKNVRSAARTGFDATRDLETKLKTLGGAWKQGKPLWTLGGVGVVGCLVAARRAPRAAAMAVAVLLMLATMAVHRGFFMYYVASIEPLVATVAAVPLGLAAERMARRYRPMAGAALLLAVAVGWGTWFGPRHQLVSAVTNTRQLTLMREVADLFPEPTPYWDLMGLAPGYPETTFFGTGEVRTRFRRRAGPEGLIELARQRKPRFFLRNYLSRDKWLTPQEGRWLWRHFVPYRPNLYLLGGRRRATAEGSGVGTKFEALVEGEYTAWFRGGWSGEASVDGRALEHGAVVALTEGEHELRAAPSEGEGELWLVLGTGWEGTRGSLVEHTDWSMFPLASRTRYQQYDRRGKTGDLRTQETDPSVDATEDERRARRHRRFQTRRADTLGAPRARPPATPPTTP